MYNQTLSVFPVRPISYTLFSFQPPCPPACSSLPAVAPVRLLFSVWLLLPLHKNYPGGSCFSWSLPWAVSASIPVPCGIHFWLYQYSRVHFQYVLLSFLHSSHNRRGTHTCSPFPVPISLHSL